MTPLERKYRELKRLHDQHRKEAAEAEGALKQLYQRLKAEHGCDSLEEAEVLLEELKAEQERLEGEFKEALEEYESRRREEEG